METKLNISGSEICDGMKKLRMDELLTNVEPGWRCIPADFGRFVIVSNGKIYVPIESTSDMDSKIKAFGKDPDGELVKLTSEKKFILWDVERKSEVRDEEFLPVIDHIRKFKISPIGIIFNDGKGNFFYFPRDYQRHPVNIMTIWSLFNGAIYPPINYNQITTAGVLALFGMFCEDIGIIPNMSIVEEAFPETGILSGYLYRNVFVDNIPTHDPINLYRKLGRVSIGDDDEPKKLTFMSIFEYGLEKFIRENPEYGYITMDIPELKIERILVSGGVLYIKVDDSITNPYTYVKEILDISDSCYVIIN